MRRFVMLALFWLAIPLLWADVSGSVTDPMSLPVSGAKVALVCGRWRQETVTAANGAFRLPSPKGEAACELEVTHPGFALFQKTALSTARGLAIQLSLAPSRDRVEVTAHDPGDSVLHAGFGSITLSDRELQQLSNNAADMIGYAKLLAGATVGSDAIYVDGLPSGSLPPAQMIASISVNADPFSAEYSDGDQNHIDIVTKSPDRQFHMNVGGGGLGLGGGNALAPGAAKSGAENWSLSGPVPFLPMAFSANATFGDAATPIAIEAVVPADSPFRGPSGPVTSSSHHGGGGFDLYLYPSETAHAHLSYAESRFGSSNLGAGGVVLPEAAEASHLLTRNLLLTVNKSWSGLLFRGGLVYNSNAARMQANSSALGVTVAGAFTGGGAPLTASKTGHADWIWKGVIESQKDSGWAAGITLGLAKDHVLQIPNPSGALQFADSEAYSEALAGANSGAWLVERGNGSVHYSNLTAAPFVQKQLFKSAHAVIRAGVRADYQSGYGAILSPRLSAAAEWRKFVFRSGAGVFAQNLADSVMFSVLEHNGATLQQYVAEGVSFANFASATLTPQDSIRSQFAPGLVRPRQYMQKSSIERPFGKFDAGVEYAWTRGSHLLGSRRLTSTTGWVDLLESDRDSVANRVHSQVSCRIGTQRLVAYHEWIDSRDDTDGPFSFPADQSDLRAEWARSAGIPRHIFTTAAMLQLPAKIFGSITESWHGPAPYNVTTGMDAFGDGLFTDRGGRPRNSGNGPAFNALSLYASRRIALPRIPSRPNRRIFIRVGLQGDNLLGNRNYAAFGSVVGSPLFGQPLSALPGRSVRLWVSLD